MNWIQVCQIYCKTQLHESIEAKAPGTTKFQKEIILQLDLLNRKKLDPEPLLTFTE
jgi:hypothetical protein